jgi:4-amino-4-deoxy-L-arabinose transferase-like glycosyltransferase
MLLGLFFRDLGNFILKNGFAHAYDFAFNYLVAYPKLSIHYPPLYFFLLAIVFSLSATVFTAKLITLLFSIATIFVTYKLGEMFYDKRTSIIAAALFSLSPLITQLSGSVMTDMPMMFFFMTTFYLYMLGFKTDKNRLYILAAITLSLGILTKWFIFPIIGILLIHLLLNYRRNVKPIKKYILSILLAALILLPYLIFMIKFNILGLWSKVFEVRFSTGNAATQHLEKNPPFYKIGAWLYYPKVLVEQMGLLMFCISVLSVIWFVWKKERYWKLIITWIIVVYVLLSVFQNKEIRYSITYLPAFSLTTAYTMNKFFGKKRLFYLVVIILILPQFFVTYYTLPRSKYPMGEVADYVYRNTKGNVALITEGGVYASGFMFNLAKLDVNRNIIVFRHCVFYNKTEDNIQQFLRDNKIYYLILVKGEGGGENFSKIKNIELQKQFDSTQIYVYKNFDGTSQKRCNYVCLTDEEICNKKF